MPISKEITENIFISGIIGGNDIAPVFSKDFLSSDDTTNIASVRSSTTPYIDSTGKWALAAANTPIFLRAWGSGALSGLFAQEPRTNKILYARPSTGLVSAHFATGSADVTIATDATAPIAGFTNSDQVWEVAASGANVTVEWAGTMGNTNSHTMQLTYKIIAGGIDQSATLSLQGNDPATLTAREWDWFYKTNITPLLTTDKLRLVVPDGMTIRFFFADVQEETGQDTNYLPHFTFPIDTTGASIARSFDLVSVTGFDAIGAEGSLSTSFVLWGGSSTEDGVVLGASSNPKLNNLEYRVAGAGDDKISAENSNVSILSQTYGNRARLPRRKNLAIAWDDQSLYAYDQGAEAFAEQVGDKSLSGLNTFYLNNVTGNNLYSTVAVTSLKIWDQKISKAQALSESKAAASFNVIVGLQSNAQRIIFKPNSALGLRGDGELEIVKTLNRYAQNADVYSIANTSLSGSSLLKANTQLEGDSAGLYLYDEDTGTLGNIWGANLSAHLSSLNISSSATTYLLWDQWQFDLPADETDPANIPISTWKIGTKFIFAHLKNLYPTLQIVVQAPAARSTSSNIIVEAFRTALLEIAAEVAYVTVLSSPLDRKLDPLEGNSHYFDEDYIVLAERFARYVLKQENLIDLGGVVGPSISSVAASGTSVTVGLTHDGGTDFTPTTGIEGFGVDVNGSAATISSAARTDATTITLTLSAPLAFGDTISLTYPAGNTTLYTDVDNTVRDNSPWALPLQAIANFSVTNNTPEDVIPALDNINIYIEATDSAKTYSSGSDVQTIAKVSGAIASMSRDAVGTEPTFTTDHLAFDTNDRLNYDADYTAVTNRFIALAIETPATLPSWGGLFALQNTSLTTDTKARLILRSNGQLLWSQNQANGNQVIVSDITASRKMIVFLDFTSNTNCDVYVDAFSAPTISFDPRDNWSGATVVNLGLGADDTLASGIGKLSAMFDTNDSLTAQEREDVYNQWAANYFT